MLSIVRRIPRPPTADVVIAAAFVVLGQLITWLELELANAYYGPRASNAILNLLLMSALAWRRSAPLTAVCWAAAVYYLPQAAVRHDMTFWAAAVPLVFLTASAGYYCSRRRAVVAVAVALLSMVVVSLTTPVLSSPDAVVWNTMVIAVPWFGAHALRKREQQAAELATELANERTTRDAARREAATAERAHIARELHDIVAHNVSMMVIQVGAARMQLPLGAANAEMPLLDAEDAGRQTLDDLRRLLGVLRADEDLGVGAGSGPAPPQPGLSELDTLVGPVREAGLDVEVEIRGDRVALPPALDLTVYRIVQEALTNTLKHSGATRTTIRLTYSPSALTIDVSDDGAGEPAGDSSGHGLAGIRERVSLYGGTVSAGHDDGGGWRVRTEFPLPVPPAVSRHAAALPTP